MVHIGVKTEVTHIQPKIYKLNLSKPKKKVNDKKVKIINSYKAVN